LDGKKITPHLRLVYLAVHKPRRYICANHDPQGRRLVSDLFADGFEQRLFHVGRLDYLSSGLIFYTNDGAFTRIATHPAFKIEKDYLIQSREEIPEDFLKSYQESLVVRDERYRLKRYRRLEGNKVVLTLGEGKNREIRRVFDAYHIRVERIHRLRIGCVFLKGIPQGGYRFLKTKEVDWFKKRGEEK
jgi:23S rRNA pseudouridine2605 synthase